MRPIVLLLRIEQRLRGIEPQTCPRRMGEAGPWHPTEKADLWERHRWGIVQRVHGWWQFGRFNRGGTYWPRGQPMPRTCSFCGGVHPEDAISLLLRGWEVSRTDKGYKAYIEPPKHRASVTKMMEAHRQWVEANTADESKLKQRFTYRGLIKGPVPLVKLYTQHCTKLQLDQINALVTRLPVVPS